MGNLRMAEIRYETRGEQEGRMVSMGAWRESGDEVAHLPSSAGLDGFAFPAICDRAGLAGLMAEAMAAFAALPGAPTRGQVPGRAYQPIAGGPSCRS